jgi:hypothetical protein
MDPETDALQTTLEAEHAAVYVYGLLGSRTSQTAEAPLYDALRSAYETHRERRDDLIGQIAAQGATPEPAATAYSAPPGIDTADGRYAAALALERGCAVTYAAMVGATAGDRRSEAIAWLNDAAARELSFRGTPEIFPGADEYADR